ncbi:EF-P lysine aminoacylase EpmA [Sandarakinorhabdus oryzae]|uniref:EF-P lysine aminoacylase EpmA n=1 Tax=Sandarakinorhabdus oryzae TaxID=2675220 RepID=UPI001EEE52EC|nr:EF-P lysine aminoacylase EpmA [Sandarakinorhabdus oryzae]
MSRPFWHADIHADRRPFLLGRNRVKAALQGWFAAQDFFAVECGAVQVSPGNETHLHGFPVLWRPNSGPEQTLYLHTSPEFAAKKLLAAGETRIVDFARVWRNGEQGPLHAPEFTMVEWYRAHDDWTAVIADTLALARAAQDAGGNLWLEWRGRRCDAHAEPEMLTCAQAFAIHAGIDLAACLDSRDALAAEVARIGLAVRADDTWSDLFSRVIVTIEPKLGDGRLTFLTHYPTQEAALARPFPDDPRWAERFEAYACGVELANGFGELTDAQEQRRRFEADMDEKQRLYGRRYPIDADFIAALAHMPPASGVALGFDRLALLALGGTHISQVIWTPFPG